MMSSRSRARSQTDIEAVRLDIEREGASVAYEALLSVCRDPKAPAQAKAAAGVAVLRAGGLYDAKRRPAPDDDPTEFSAAELAQSVRDGAVLIAKIEAEIAERKAFLDAAIVVDDDDESDVFA